MSDRRSPPLVIYTCLFIAYESYFTFHGFRYVEITGWPGTPTLNDIEGETLIKPIEIIQKKSDPSTQIGTIESII